jgi:SAM-dependent methyltransferase
MSSQLRRRSVTGARKVLETAVRRPVVRRLARRTISELERAVNDPTASGIYGSEYFGANRDSMDRMGLSGYERYDRDTSNSNAAAYMVWRHFPVRKTLDVGCAAGFVVEAMRELGLDARGTDISHYAIEHAAQGAAGFLEWGDLMAGLPYRDGEFELLTCLETLEHMKPDMIPTVLTELRRITSKYLVCTIPSFGPNANGPGGWFDVKVRPEKMQEYIDKGDDYAGPVPYDDLYRDARGEPIEGHLTIASFDWWTEQFEKAGFVRCGRTEMAIHPSLARFALTEYWNLYVFRTPDASEPVEDQRTPDELAHWEHNFKLDSRPQRLRDYERLNESRSRNGLAPLPIPPSATSTN